MTTVSDDAWSDEDAMYGRKVAYITNGGAPSTAYLESHRGGHRYTGTDKHTDKPVTVLWNGSDYVEEPTL